MDYILLKFDIIKRMLSNRLSLLDVMRTAPESSEVCLNVL